MSHILKHKNSQFETIKVSRPEQNVILNQKIDHFENADGLVKSFYKLDNVLSCQKATNKIVHLTAQHSSQANDKLS